MFTLLTAVRGFAKTFSIGMLLFAGYFCWIPATDAAPGLLLVANKGDHTLGIIDVVA